MWCNLDPAAGGLKGYFDSGDPSRDGYVALYYRRWATFLASFFVTPYIPLLLTPIPFSATLEIMSIFLLVLVVIIPTIKGGWNAFSDTRVIEVFGATKLWAPCCLCARSQ